MDWNPHTNTHSYMSTACLHASMDPTMAHLHEYCGCKQRERGDDTVPHCKFCDSPCVCLCHGGKR